MVAKLGSAVATESLSLSLKSDLLVVGQKVQIPPPGYPSVWSDDLL